MKVWYLEDGQSVQLAAPVEESCAVTSWYLPMEHFSHEMLAADAN